MRTAPKLLWKSQKGTAAVISALMMTTILGFSALVIDIGRVSLEKSRLQNAVDAAALAAAQDLPDTSGATATATSYMEKNGYTSSDVNISFDKFDYRITVKGMKKVSYTLAKVIGLVNTNVKSTAAAEKGGKYLTQAFDYAVFSGSTLDELTINSNGRPTNVIGSIHSNDDFRYNGNGTPLSISGELDTVGRITLNGDQVSIGSQDPYSDYIDMPDFSDTVRSLAENAGTYYNTSQDFNHDITLNDAIYVDGHINFNCQKLSGVGTIMATDNIIFNNSVAYGDPSSSVCIYSKDGSITVNNTSATVYGNFYAPNGTVTFNYGAHTIYGRVIAKKLIFNGGITVYSSDSDVSFMETIDEKIRLVR